MNNDNDGDEVADFSTLLNKTKKGGGGAPKRGKKTFAPDDTSTQQKSLDQSRDALFELIGETKPLATQHSIGILNDNSDHTWTTTLQQKRGTYYQFMGHAVQGNMVLYLEEAAWLMNRHALSCSITQSGSSLLNITTTGVEYLGDDTIAPTSMVTFEDYCSLMFTSMDGWITYEKYQVYAYLKRLGYIVQRSSLTSQSSNVNTNTTPPSSSLPHMKEKKGLGF
ncbi:unnamed protein product [Absidia cylindrospora]